MHFIGDVVHDVGQAFTGIEQATRNISSGTFTVNQDNVLAAARIINTQVDSLQEIFRDIRRNLQVEAPGTDDVSTRMAAAWNDLLIENDDSYRNRVGDYIASLQRLVEQLGDTALAYGYSEDEIASAFGNPSA